jgi:hypothetical protein
MKDKKLSKVSSSSGSGGAYCLGALGSAVYYIQQAEGFWAVILALLKALVWPAFVVYDLLKFMG